MNFLLRASIVSLTLLLTACFEDIEAPSDAPANVTVTEGSGLVVVDWDTVADRTYWIFYKQGDTVSTTDYDRILLGVRPPYVVTNLENDVQYAFTVTSSKNGSKVGPSSPVLTSTPRLLSPSIAWTVGTALGGGANNLNSIAYGDNTYVTVGDTATIYSAEFDYPNTGGVEDTGWVVPTTVPAGLTANLTSVIYDGARFLVLGDDGSITKSTDAEALEWEDATAITTPPLMNAMAYGGGTYVAVGNGGDVYYNTSGAVVDPWTQATSVTANNLLGVAYVNNMFIAVGDVGTILTSPDGVTWTSQTPVTGDSLRGIAYGASTYVAVGDAGAAASSSDAVTWGLHTAPTTESFRDITFGPDDQFVAVGTTGVVAYSSTGADGSWATSSEGVIELKSVSPNLLYIAVGAAGANVSGK